MQPGQGSAVARPGDVASRRTAHLIIADVASGLNLDIYQLTALDHLLRDRSVTATAKHLGVTQPAVSGVLAKLRRHFDDDLLVRRRGGYELTPLAAVLAERIPSALAEIRDLLDAPNGFVPAASTREFRVLCSDHFSSIYGSGVVERAHRSAPHVTFRFSPFAKTTLTDLEHELLGIDGMLLPRASIPDVPFIDVAVDEWVFVACERSSAARRGLSVEDLEAAPWALFRVESGGHCPPVEFLQSQGLTIRHEISVNYLASVPFLVSRSDRIGIVPRRLATTLAPASRTTVLDSPVLLPSLVMTMLYHPARETDPAHAWLRTVLPEPGVGERT